MHIDDASTVASALKNLLPKSLLLLTLASVPVVGNTADGQGNYAIWGPGGNSCNHFNHAFEKNDVGDYQAYLMGYLTAINTLTPDTYEATGRNSITESLKAVADYCATNPIDSVDRALHHLLDATHESRVRAAPGSGGGWGRPPSAQAH